MLQHTATHCNTLQHTAPPCNTLQHTATHCKQRTATHCNTLQHTTTHYITLQHAAAHCHILQHTATHCNTLQHTAIHCNTLQHMATHSNTLQHTATHKLQHTATLCNTLQLTATHCHTLPHIATHCSGVEAMDFLHDGALLVWCEEPLSTAPTVNKMLVSPGWLLPHPSTSSTAYCMQLLLSTDERPVAMARIPMSRGATESTAVTQLRGGVLLLLRSYNPQIGNVLRIVFVDATTLAVAAATGASGMRWCMWNMLVHLDLYCPSREAGFLH